MGKAPAFPLYAADFYMDTLTWDTDDIGVYFCLLMAEWVNGPLEKDTRKLAKIAKKTHQKFIKNFSKISQKFVVICTENGEFLVNNRLEEERKKQQYYKELQRVKGIKSGKSRFNHGLTTVEPTPQPKGNLSLSSSLSSSKIQKNIKHIGDAKKNTSPDVKFFIDYAFEAFQNKYAQKMLVDGGKDGAIVKKLLKTYGLERLKGLWDVFIQSHDPFICQAGRSIGVFKTQINKLISGGSNGNGNGAGKFTQKAGSFGNSGTGENESAYPIDLECDG